MRIVFMGTPQFAAPGLERLAADGHQIAGVYTQPDRPAGRGREPSPSPVKRAAVRLGLPVFQPRSLRNPEAQEQLRALTPDLIALAAYGLILPQAVLDIPKHGGLNIHPSLLPRHRGPAPIVGALLAGDTETGVSIMLMDAGMDTGQVLACERCPIAPDDTTHSLTEKLSHQGAALLSGTAPRWLAGEITPRPQDDGGSSYTKLVRKEDGAIDWAQPAEVIARQVRAYQPWPGSATAWNGKRLLVTAAVAVPAPPGMQKEPGTVIQLAEPAQSVAVCTGEGLLRLHAVQLEGKRALPVDEFLRGARDFIGSVLG